MILSRTSNKSMKAGGRDFLPAAHMAYFPLTTWNCSSKAAQPCLFTDRKLRFAIVVFCKNTYTTELWQPVNWPLPCNQMNQLTRGFYRFYWFYWLQVFLFYCNHLLATIVFLQVFLLMRAFFFLFVFIYLYRDLLIFLLCTEVFAHSGGFLWKHKKFHTWQTKDSQASDPNTQWHLGDQKFAPHHNFPPACSWIVCAK